MERTNSKISINILDVLKLIKRNYKETIIYLFSGAIIGIIVAFSIPKVYKSTVILAPEEMGNGFSGSISSLASMVGMNMNLGQNGDAIYPEIYPDVMGSSDFLVSLFSVQVTTQDKSYSSDYATYLQKKTKLPWWSTATAWMIMKLKPQEQKDGVKYSQGKQVNPFNLTMNEWEITQAMNGNLSCSVDKKTNVITLTVKDQDPYIAACIADTIKNRLQALITQYRTKKARNDVKYLEQIYAEAQSKYNSARAAYAGYKEGHQLVVLESVNQHADKLKSEMQLHEEIYNTVAEQLQLARAKVQEKTPAFTTIQNASVPVKHSNTPKVMIIALWVFIAFGILVLVLMYRNWQMFIVPMSE